MYTNNGLQWIHLFIASPWIEFMQTHTKCKLIWQWAENIPTTIMFITLALVPSWKTTHNCMNTLPDCHDKCLRKFYWIDIQAHSKCNPQSTPNCHGRKVRPWTNLSTTIQKKNFCRTAKYETKYPRKLIETSKSFSMIQNMNCEEREQTSWSFFLLPFDSRGKCLSMQNNLKVQYVMIHKKKIHKKNKHMLHKWEI